jgi:hypothetical protein
VKLKNQALKQLVYLRSVIWQFYRDKIYLSAALALLLGLTIYLLNKVFYPTNFWTQFSIHEGIEYWFCEFTDMKKFIRQPINSFTNFWYIVNTIFFFSKGVSDMNKTKKFNLITANPFYSIALGFISLYTFAASFFYHSSLIKIAHHLDYSAVYSISLFPLMYLSHRFILLQRNKPTNEPHAAEAITMIATYSVIYLLLTLFLPDAYMHGVVLGIIISIFSLGFWLEYKDPGKTSKGFMLASITSITIALVFFVLDPMKVGCNPDSFLQFHSIWHILNGLAVFYFYLYIRSENYQPEKDEKLLPFRKKHLED